MLDDLFRECEGKTLEFKENTCGILEILKTVVAFANTQGGTIVIGVKDKSKEILGIKNPLLEEEKLANVISDSISPLLIPEIELITYRNKELLIIRHHFDDFGDFPNLFNKKQLKIKALDRFN